MKLTVVELCVHERQQRVSEHSDVLHYLLSVLTPNRRVLVLCNNIQIVTGFKIIIENSFHEVRKILPNAEDRRQYFRNFKQKISNNDQRRQLLFVFLYNAKFVLFYNRF